MWGKYKVTVKCLYHVLNDFVLQNNNGVEMNNVVYLKQYKNCSCVSYDTGTTPSYMAMTGKCESTCTMLPFFMAIFFFIMFFTFVISMPALSATLR